MNLKLVYYCGFIYINHFLFTLMNAIYLVCKYLQ